MMLRRALSSGRQTLTVRRPISSSSTSRRQGLLHHHQSLHRSHPQYVPPAARCYSVQTTNWDVHFSKIALRTSSQVNFDVGYVDSAYDVGEPQKSSMPVLLGLHGCPGTHRDIQDFLKPYAEKGFRVVLPNMPSFGITKFSDRDSPGFRSESFYRHSPKEQAEFVAQFLRALGIAQLQLVVGHSVGVLAPMLLCASGAVPIGAAVFLCAFHGHKAPRGMRPYWLVQQGGRMWYKDSVGSKITRYLMVQAYRQFIAKRNKVKYSDEEEVGAIIQTGYNVGFDELPGYARTMAGQKTPLLYVVTDSDPLIDAKESMEFAEMLGIKPEDFVSYDKDGKIAQNPVEKDGDVFLRGIRLASSSHTPHLEPLLADIMQKEINAMLDRL